MPFDLGPWAALWLALAVFGAGWLRGYSGFGFSALVVASAALVTHPLHLVAVVVVLEVVLSLQAVLARGAGGGRDGLWRDVEPPVVVALAFGAAIGLPLGLAALTRIPETGARIAIALGILLLCAVLMAGWRMQRRGTRGEDLAVGIASGLANAPAMGGLPVAAWFAAQPMPAASFRANLVVYFPLLDLFALPLYWLHGLVSADTVTAVVLMLGPALAGNWLGARYFLRSRPRDFRRISIVLLAGLALAGLAKALL